jgi:hypothetical protein
MSTQKSKGVAWNPLPIVVDFEKIYISLPWSGGVWEREKTFYFFWE